KREKRQMRARRGRDVGVSWDWETANDEQTQRAKKLFPLPRPRNEQSTISVQNRLNLRHETPPFDRFSRCSSARDIFRGARGGEQKTGNYRPTPWSHGFAVFARREKDAFLWQ